MYNGVFQSTLPTRGSDCPVLPAACCSTHFNPRSPRGGATAMIRQCWEYIMISIHAPHEGERHDPPVRIRLDRRISIHAPHEGERPVAPPPSAGLRDFNPRSPRGGATPLSLLPLSLTKDFNPRSPRGGATSIIHISIHKLHISIHAPHEGERP